MPFISTENATYDATNNRYNFTIPENSSAGTIIGQVRFDGGGAGTTYFTILGSDRTKVRIDDDGVIRLTDGVSLDHEGNDGVQSLSIELSALFFGDDGTVDTGDTSGTKVTVGDIDEGPTLSAALAATSFAEHSPTNTVIATFTSADEDGDDISYSLSGTHAGLFEIVGNEVRLKDAKKFDFETLRENIGGASIDLTLTASSTGSSGTAQTAEQTLTVKITDINEPLTFTPQDTPFELAENSVGGTAVGQVSARDGDGDPVTYSLASHSDKFLINETTGAITVRDGAELDYEAHGDDNTNDKGQITLTINAVANGPNGRKSDATQDVTIQLGNVNEPVTFDAPPQTFTLNENSTAGTAIGSVTATDGDGDPVTYSLYGTGDENFIIDSNTGAISVAKRATLDYETKSEYVLKVGAGSSFEGGQPTIRTQVVRIKLNDLNEPLAFDPATPFEVAENSAGGTVVGQVIATDGDGDPVIYSLANHTNKFLINETTGAITVKDGAVLDYEAHKNGQITLTVNAVANGANGRISTASQDVTVQLTDAPEPPELTVTPVAMPVNEHVAKDTVVASFTARDPDGDPVRVFVTGKHASLFTIVGNDLVVANPNGLNFETLGNSIDVTLTATSRASGAHPLLDSKTFTLQLNDIDEAPEFTEESYVFTAAENTAPGISLGTVRAVDPDHDGDVTYVLTGAHAAMFKINDKHELVLKAGQTLDYEALKATNGLISMTATATSSRNGVDKHDTAEIRLQVTNVDEAPMFHDADDQPITAQTVRVDENDAGAILTRLNAIDPDGDVPVRYFVTSQRDKFMIDGSNLRLKSGVALDYEALTDGRITVQVSAVSRQTGERPQVTKIDVTVEVNNRPDVYDLTLTHDVISQHDLTARLKLATKVNVFNPQQDSLRFAEGTTEIWVRQIDDPEALGEQSTLVTAVNAKLQALHYAVIVGLAMPLTEFNFYNPNILIRTEVVNNRKHNAEVTGTSGDDYISDYRWVYQKFSGGDGNDIFSLEGSAPPHTGLHLLKVILDFTPGRREEIPLKNGGDKIRIIDASTISYRAIDHNRDGILDGTLIYDGLNPNGRIFGYLKGYTKPLFASDFIGNIIVGTVDESEGLNLYAPAEGWSTGIYGTSQNDVLRGGKGLDFLFGSRGEDRLVGGKGPNQMFGGDGNDIFELTATFDEFWGWGSVSRIADFKPGRDGNTALADSGDKILIRGVNAISYRVIDHHGEGSLGTLLYDGSGLNGQVVAYLMGFTGTLFASDFIGDVTFHRIDDSNGLTLTGNVKHNSLYGSINNDILIGGLGEDTLVGGPGKDIMTGGRGNDVFNVADIATNIESADRITDFNSNGEKDQILVVHSTDANVWYRRVDTNDDDIVDTTILYNNAFGENGVYAVLENFIGELSGDDFIRSSGITLSEIL